MDNKFLYMILGFGSAMILTSLLGFAFIGGYLLFSRTEPHPELTETVMEQRPIESSPGQVAPTIRDSQLPPLTPPQPRQNTGPNPLEQRVDDLERQQQQERFRENLEQYQWERPKCSPGQIATSSGCY